MEVEPFIPSRIVTKRTETELFSQVPVHFVSHQKKHYFYIQNMQWTYVLLIKCIITWQKSLRNLERQNTDCSKVK